MFKQRCSLKKINNTILDQASNNGLDTGRISDGRHTFQELYLQRMMFHAALLNEWGSPRVTVGTTNYLKPIQYDVHKSWKHSDGEYCPDGGFVVVAELPTGQISAHYEPKYWELFRIPEKKVPNEYDGHSSKDVEERIFKFLKNKI